MTHLVHRVHLQIHEFVLAPLLIRMKSLCKYRRHHQTTGYQRQSCRMTQVCAQVTQLLEERFSFNLSRRQHATSEATTARRPVGYPSTSSLCCIDDRLTSLNLTRQTAFSRCTQRLRDLPRVLQPSKFIKQLIDVLFEHRVHALTDSRQVCYR